MEYHVYSPIGMYRAAFDPERCAASIWTPMGNGSSNSQCLRPGKYKIGKHVWCKQHAQRFPTEDQPEELRPKKVEGARFWPGQTIYRVNLMYGDFELLMGEVKSLRKDGVVTDGRSEISRYKLVAPFDFVFPTIAEAYADAASQLRVEIQDLERDLAEKKQHLATAEEKAKS